MPWSHKEVDVHDLLLRHFKYHATVYGSEAAFVFLLHKVF